MNSVFHRPISVPPPERPAHAARPARDARHPKRARAFTAVEVLIAMTVMAIGAAGVISMQRASVQGNLDARKADIANSIARTWVERLQRDISQWTQPGPSSPLGNNMANAQVIAAGITGQNAWFAPTQYWTAQGFSPSFDILGRDVAAGGVFCANVRLNWLTATQDLIRADVRVLWSRGIDVGTAVGDPCGPAAQDMPDPTLYHAIYVTTALKGNPQ
jgi:prepilin-type N-terminal cleavage/methylation domain-containing protein